MRKVLWIIGRLPYPLHSGDALYSAGLLRAVHAAGLSVTVAGMPRDPDLQICDLNDVAPVQWQPVFCKPRPALGSLLSALPKDAYSLYPPRIRHELTKLLEREWDWIVFDHARSAGALDLALAKGGSPIAYIAHNVERTVRREVAAGMSRGVLRTPYVIDAAKYARLEDKLVRNATAVITITGEDAAEFRRAGATAYHVAPVFMGRKVRSRDIDATVPRRVLLLGSFDWVAKQKNLARFLEVVGPRLAGANIGIDIVGSVPQALQQNLQQTYRNVQFQGAVADVGFIAAQVRAGVIPEELGGGMKMKTLDYIFMRLPIFSLQSGVIGLPPEARDAAFVCKDMAGLGDAILNSIDDVQQLNRRQVQAFDTCEKYFSVEQAATVLRRVFGG